MAELQKELEELKGLIPELLTKKELGAEIEKTSAKYQETLKSYEEKINALQGKFDEIDKSFAEKISGLKIKKANGLTDEDKLNFGKMLIGMKNDNQKQISDSYKAIENKDLASDVDADGGYTVPTPVANEIYRIAKDSSLILSGATNIPFKGDKMRLPTLTNSVSIYWVGQNTTPTKSDPKFGKVDFDKEKAMGYSVVSSEMLTDPQIGIVDFLLGLFAEETGYSVDEQAFVGTGSPFTGILNNTGVNTITMDTGNTSFKDLSENNLVDLITPLAKRSKNGAMFYGNTEIISVIRKLKDSNGFPLWSNPVSGDPAQILGYGFDSSNPLPDLSEDAVDTPFMFFGNLKNVVISTEAMSLALQYQAKLDSYDVVSKKRIAIAIPVPKHFSIIKTAAS